MPGFAFVQNCFLSHKIAAGIEIKWKSLKCELQCLLLLAAARQMRDAEQNRRREELQRRIEETRMKLQNVSLKSNQEVQARILQNKTLDCSMRNENFKTQNSTSHLLCLFSTLNSILKTSNSCQTFIQTLLILTQYDRHFLPRARTPQLSPKCPSCFSKWPSCTLNLRPRFELTKPGIEYKENLSGPV